jgi:hypothetical protein
LYSKSARLPGEDEAEYLQHQTEIAADLQPEGAVQKELALLVSDSFWRLRRVRLLEHQEVDRQLAELSESTAENTPEKDPSGFVPASDCKRLETLGRHHQRIANGAHKALNQLRELQKEIREKNEANGAAEAAMREKIMREIQYKQRVLRFNSVDPWSPYWSGAMIPPPAPGPGGKTPPMPEPDPQEPSV